MNVSTTSAEISTKTNKASVTVSRFEGRSGVSEIHLMIRPNAAGSIDTQLR